MWRQRLRLGSAVLVCAIIVAVWFPAYLLWRYVRGLWRDVKWWLHRRRLYMYSQKRLRADSKEPTLNP